MITLKSEGFSLVEVVIIVGILSLGLLVFTRVFPYGFEVKRKAENYSRVGILAQNLIEDIRRDGYKMLDKKYPEVSSGYGKGNGKFKKYPGVNWQVEWWQTDVPNLRKVRVIVYDDERENSPSRIEIVTYIAKRY